jgi:hypothetical protein
VLQVRSGEKLAALALLGTLLFGCAHAEPKKPEVTLAVDAAPGNPVVLLLSEDCPVARAMEQAFLQGGIVAQTADLQDDAAALAKLNALVPEHEARPRRFLLGLGEKRARIALQATADEKITGLILIDPPPLHFSESHPVPVPTLMVVGKKHTAREPPGAPVWEMLFQPLDAGWRELPPDQLHSLTEAAVLWVRVRAAEPAPE